ncbi:MAG: ROK family transcriptional regulator [Acidobacteriota bacterium]
MRSANGIGLLNLIRQHAPVSRASLARLSRLSKPTVSNCVESLIEQGWVFEQGQGESGARGGKKPMLVRFNSDAGRLVAVELGAEQIRIALADLDGTIVDRLSLPTQVTKGAARVLDRAVCGIEKIFERDRARPRQRVIGVAAPGRVDVRQGIVLEAGNLFHWREVNIRERLERTFHGAVYVDNNVNMAALGELHHGSARNSSNFVLVRLDTGIGCGVVTGGKLHQGTHWAAGEIAHMVFDTSHARDDWRVRGYLESIVGSDRSEAGARAIRARGDGSKALDNAALHLGMAVTSVICAYDPAMVVLQGEGFRPVLARIKEIVSKTVPWETKICMSVAGDDAVILGTIEAARAYAYNGIAHSLAGSGRAPSAAILDL